MTHIVLQHSNCQPRWQQSGVLKKGFELRADDELTGFLRFQGTSSSLATARIADGYWLLKRVGFRHTRVAQRSCGEYADVADFWHDTWSGGGTLAFLNGHRFLAETDSWRAHLEFKDESNNALVRIDASGIFRLSATVGLFATTSSVPELPLLIISGWYFLVLIYGDYADAAVSEAIRLRYSRS